jgi:hypothetical protein
MLTTNAVALDLLENTIGEKLPFLKAPFFSRQHGDRPDPTEEA